MTRQFNLIKLRVLSVLLFGMLTLSVFSEAIVLAEDVPKAAEKQQPVKPSETGSKTVSINFNDVDINVLIKLISELTGKNFIIDNNVKGKVTIISPGEITVDEAYKVFESVLEVNGFATVPSGKFVKIIPSGEARAKNIETRTQDESASYSQSPDDKLITQLIPLTYADAAEIKTLFTPLVSKNSVIISYTDTNTLIVTDSNSNIRRLQHILEAIDIPGIGKEISVIPLEYATSENIVKTLTSVFKSTEAGDKNAAKKSLQFVSDDRTNSVIFLASEDDTNRIKQLITLLDKDTPKGSGNIRVYYLENATAEDMAKVLQDLPQGQTSSNTDKKDKESVFVSSDIKITADKATNSLIIMASSEDFPVIDEIIKKLDIPRSMVYIECLIMEVNVDKEFTLGTQWTILQDTELGGDTGYAGGSFGGGVTSGSLSDLAASSGMALGITTGSATTLSIGGVAIAVPNLGALIKAVDSNSDVNIVSKPQLLTTDNTEATIKVGKKVPMKTTISTSTTENSTYNSYEYKDVGLTLKITPHISKDRMVRLEISQELSALASNTATETPTTYNRSVETTVIVKDQNLLVIGGLIDDKINNSVNKVPILGHIPIFGRLFRSDSKTREKTNLYIFIAPRVINTPAEAETLLSQEKEKMSSDEIGLIKLYGPKANITTIPETEESTQ